MSHVLDPEGQSVHDLGEGVYRKKYSSRNRECCRVAYRTSQLNNIKMQTVLQEQKKNETLKAKVKLKEKLEFSNVNIQPIEDTLKPEWTSSPRQKE